MAILQITKENFDAINAMTDKHRHLCLTGDKYIIRPFKDWYEFLKEGDSLRHAVAYYAINRYRIGRDYLFVMRKADDPDTPYITLEFDPDGELTLAKMLHNKNVDDASAASFIVEFRKKVLMPYIIEQKKSTT